MDQKTIVEALQRSLANGTGGLDDLDKLLRRAQQDIVTAKEEEKKRAEEREAQRGKKIANLANRLLEGKTTDEDCAQVLNAWLAARGHKGAPFTAKDLEEIFIKSESEANKVADDLVNDFNKAINQLADSLKDWKFTYTNKKPDPPKKPAANADADDVINDFLKKFGIR